MKKDLIKSAEELRRLGRNGDTILAHINPREAAILKSMGGAGSTNPKSGLPEFFDWGGDWGGGWSMPDYSWSAPSYSWSAPVYTPPVYEPPVYTPPVYDFSAPVSTWQGTAGSNSGAFGGITNTPEYQAVAPSDPITNYVNTPVNMGDPYNLISSGPSYNANQDANLGAIDYLYNDLKYTGELGAGNTPDASPPSVVQPQPGAPEVSEEITGGLPPLNTEEPEISVTPEQDPQPEAPEEITGGLPSIDDPAPENLPSISTSPGNLDNLYGESDALTGDVKIPSDLDSGPLPSWSYDAESPEAKSLADNVVQDVFKAPAESKPGFATNGMNRKQLIELRDSGRGEEMISDTQTVNQAIGALQLSRMKPGQVLSLMGGIISGNPVAIASAIASISGAPKVAGVLGVASNIASGNMVGAAAGIASLADQKEAAYAIRLANALAKGDMTSIISGVASLTGNNEIAEALGAINAVTSKDPFKIAGVFAKYAPSLANLDSRQAANTVASSAARDIAPSKDFSDAWNYSQQSGVPSSDYLANLQSSVLPSGEIDYARLGINLPLYGGSSESVGSNVPSVSGGATEEPVLADSAAPLSRSASSAVEMPNLDNFSDSSSLFLDSRPEFLAAKKIGGLRTLADAANVGELKQIFQAPTQGLPEPETAIFASGGTTKCLFTDFDKSINPKFVEDKSSDFLTGTPVRQRQALQKQLIQMQKNISQMGNMGGLAHGGLPKKYKDAAPDGHNPEFVTGLTGFYACGRGTGQSDCIPAMLHDGDYVMDAEAVSALGDGSSKAGREVLEKFHKQIPHKASTGGKVVPAKIADGEYVFPAGFVTALGGGDNKRGAEILDGLREKLRNHKRSAPTSKIPPKAKSPLDYLKMAKG